MNGKTIATLLVLLLCIAVTVAGIRLFEEPELEETEPKVEDSVKEPSQEVVDSAGDEKQENENQEPEQEAVDWNSWELLLANVDNPLPSDFTVETETVQGNFKMDARVAEAMKQMIADAK